MKRLASLYLLSLIETHSKVMKLLFKLFVLALLLSCSVNTGAIGEANMRVNSYTAECVGEMEGTCLLVQEGDKMGTEDWEYFYYVDSIEGFSYEPGFIYDLQVKKIPIENPPMDGSSIKYELVKVISKKKV